MKKMNLWKNEDTQTKILFSLSIGIFVAVLIPLFWISHYNFRSVDDFSYIRKAEAVWEKSHSIINVFLSQLSYVKEYYFSWQGTFFNTWFSSSILGMIGKNAYYVGTYLTLGGFALAEFLLLYVIFLKILKADIFSAGTVTACCLSFQILMTPVPSEAYFWFVGAVLYIFAHALALFLVAILIEMYYVDKLWIVIVLEILAVILTIAVGGSNYVTGLTVLVVYGLGTLWVLYKRHAYKWIYLGNALLYTAALLINVLAPGNQKRLDASGAANLSAIEAIFRSLKEAAKYVVTNMYLPCIILGFMFLPLFIKIVKKSKYRYSFPILITLLSFGVFAAQFTPTLYTLGILGAGRVLNLYRLNFYILLYGNELYWTGWYVRRCEERYEIVEKRNEKSTICLLLPAWCVGGLLLCYALIFYGGQTLTSVSAFMSLRTGQAQQYYQENLERLELLEDESLDEVYLKDFTYKPYVLYFDDIKENPENWINRSMANYFGKKTVYLLTQDE